ncbi:MAG: DEAD/DEAH box helicase [Chloroherpetonaceae bacterium]|nr:DEAD/DEAH box helicase [Chloroherpetonaceae bacterium]
MSFTQLGLSDALVQGILATGYEAPTEIQSRAIPLAVEGKDVIGLAQTGTGKTAAYVLPLLHRLSLTPTEKKRPIRALILSPTRELASQIEKSVKEYGRFMKFFSLTIYGGTDMRRQIRDLHRGFDILIATPGRLIDHIGQGTIDLSAVEILVLDEADRMLDMGFVNDVKKIISFLPEERQTLLFSATMSQGIQALTSSVQNNPSIVEVGTRRKTADSVAQKFYKVPQEKKFDLLFHILDTVEMDSVLVFSRTKHGADKIQHRLDQRGVKAIAIHSNRTQSQRERALNGFRKKHFKVLVATDIAARGIDIDGISHVINYDTPTYAEDYVHRIGRTGRAATTGDAITFVSPDEFKHFKSISQFVGKRFEVANYPGFDYSAASSSFGRRSSFSAEGEGDVAMSDENFSEGEVFERGEQPSREGAPTPFKRGDKRVRQNFERNDSRRFSGDRKRPGGWKSNDRKERGGGRDSRDFGRKRTNSFKPTPADELNSNGKPEKIKIVDPFAPDFAKPKSDFKKGRSFGSKDKKFTPRSDFKKGFKKPYGKTGDGEFKQTWKNQSDQDRFKSDGFKSGFAAKKKTRSFEKPASSDSSPKTPAFRPKKNYPLFDSEERKKQILQNLSSEGN